MSPFHSAVSVITTFSLCALAVAWGLCNYGFITYIPVMLVTIGNAHTQAHFPTFLLFTSFFILLFEFFLFPPCHPPIFLFFSFLFLPVFFCCFISVYFFFFYFFHVLLSFFTIFIFIFSVYLFSLILLFSPVLFSHSILSPFKANSNYR